MKNQKQKRIPKTKEQIIAEEKMKAEVNRLRPIAKGAIFQPLHDHATSISHAQRTCEILKVVMQGKMNQYWVDKTVGELGMLEELAKDEKMTDRDMYLAVLEGLSDVKIVDAMKLIEGMNGSIEGYMKKEYGKKPFSDLKVEELIG